MAKYHALFSITGDYEATIEAPSRENAAMVVLFIQASITSSFKVEDVPQISKKYGTFENVKREMDWMNEDITLNKMEG